MNILSPQRMPDILPVPWHERPLADIGFPTKAIEAARQAGYVTLGDLPRKSPGTLTDWLTTFPGIGEKTASTIAQAYWAYRGVE